jgi:uncharacterized protein YkwD
LFLHRLSLLLFALISFFSFSASSQSLEDTIDVRAFNSNLISKLMLEKVNQIRDSLHLSILEDDPILFKAAQSQVNFIVKTNQLTHIQKKKKLATPIDRVKYFKGAFLIVEENCSATFTGKPIIERDRKEHIYYTYRQVANVLIKAWVNTPKNFKNMINKDMKLSGIALSINPGKGEIFAVHVVGTKTKPPVVIPKYEIKKYDAATCKPCDDALLAMPPNIKFGYKIVEGEIFLTFSDLEYLKRIINQPKDAFALDIVQKNLFPCSGTNLIDSTKHYQGILIIPVLRDSIFLKNQAKEKKELLLSMGKLPSDVNGDFEVNLMILKNQRLCKYYNFYGHPSIGNDILDIGLIRDSIHDKTHRHIYHLFSHERLNFVVPFEKNKFTYQREDILPLFDSLKTKKGSLKYIHIKVYSSVEGSLDLNQNLQVERAMGIVKLLQSQQADSITTKIESEENWAAFFSDIRNTAYKDLKDLSKEEIKEKLKDEQVKADLEPILKNHRKATIMLLIENKKDIKAEDTEGMKLVFKQNIQRKNIKEAVDIQSHFLSYVRRKILSEEFLDTLVIPETLLYGRLLSNKAAFKYFEGKDSMDIHKAYAEFSRLQKLIPSNPYLIYNLSVLKIKMWHAGEDSIIKHEVMLKEIQSLLNMHIDKKMVKRLLIDFYLLATDHFVKTNQLKLKEQALNYINTSYASAIHNEEELMLLTNYLIYYDRSDLALKILHPHAVKHNVSENLLFYYIALTIINDFETSKINYASILHSAIKINKERFCKLFSSTGITFQLLNNDKLKTLYCQECEE